MGILSAVASQCERASPKVATFFLDYRGYLLDKYASVAGTIIGVHRLLMEKRIGKEFSQGLDALSKKIRSGAYYTFKDKFLNLSFLELNKVCSNFVKQIKAGDWDVFRLADRYFLSLKPYLPDFFEANKNTWAEIQRMQRE